MTAFDSLVAAADALRPRTAIILGSGLAKAVVGYETVAVCPFAEAPGLAGTSVQGHLGQVSVGRWGGSAVIVFHGRLHFYEGKPWPLVTATVDLAHRLGATRLLLTNAAGGIHPDLNPGDLMAISGHRRWLDPSDFAKEPAERLFSVEWANRLIEYERANGRRLIAGTYAALTGPCYETPAEIRALKAISADAVGMSTVREAERGVALGMTVIGLSCITNKAAGLSPGPLDHAEVLANASAPAERVGRLAAFVAAFPSINDEAANFQAMRIWGDTMLRP